MTKASANGAKRSNPTTRCTTPRRKGKPAILSLSDDGALIAVALRDALGGDLYLHTDVVCPAAGRLRPKRFARVTELTGEIFARYRELVYIMPTGVVVRAVAPLAQSKLTDPAVVVVDVRARYAISLLSGHEGGANNLALRVANCTGAEPVITTTTEARKDIIAGIGCRKGVAAAAIQEALLAALALAEIPLERVRLLATAPLKAQEPGLLQAAAALQIPLRIVGNEEIRNCRAQLTASEFVREKTGLPGVCEPAALLAGRRTQLLLKKTARKGVTVALAQEMPACCG